jgi:hypothetical protein
MKRIVVTTQQLVMSRKKTDLLCDFYGHTHPKCKKAINRDVFLYEKYIEQFKVYTSEDKKDEQKVNE